MREPIHERFIALRFAFFTSAAVAFAPLWLFIFPSCVVGFALGSLLAVASSQLTHARTHIRIFISFSLLQLHQLHQQLLLPPACSSVLLAFGVSVSVAAAVAAASALGL